MTPGATRWRLRLARAAAAAAVAAGACAAVVGQDKPPPKPTAEDWKIALEGVERIALDAHQAAEDRANAILAYAKLQAFRAQHAAGVALCRKVLAGAYGPEAGEAAVRAACYLSRHQLGHLGGAWTLLKTWRRLPPHAVNKIRQDLARAANHLMGLARQPMVPGPLRAQMPNWGQTHPKSGVAVVSVAGPRIATPGWMIASVNRGAAAIAKDLPPVAPERWTGLGAKGTPEPLKASLPVYVPPTWYGRTAFTPLKEPRK